MTYEDSDCIMNNHRTANLAAAESISALAEIPIKTLKILSLISLIFLLSCSSDESLNNYFKLIDTADKFKFYEKFTDTFALEREVVSFNELQNVKSILKRNIKHESQKEIIPTNKIEIYSKDQLIGTLTIRNSGDKPFANFNGIIPAFGFRLTYAIGMSL